MYTCMHHMQSEAGFPSTPAQRALWKLKDPGLAQPWPSWQEVQSSSGAVKVDELLRQEDHSCHGEAMEHDTGHTSNAHIHCMK